MALRCERRREMIYEDFIDAVARRAGVSAEQAATLTRATLRTLAERISGGEAEDLASELPDALGKHLRKPPNQEFAEPFGLEEFVRRVSEQADVAPTVAAASVRAVLTTLREAVTGDEFEDMVAQLPKEFREVIEPVGARREGGR
jgi:uncharacterized protein (DUF2267 family)